MESKGFVHVCNSADYIFVVSSNNNSPPEVYLFSQTGIHIQILSTQQLGVKKDDLIHAIKCNHDGTVLQLAIGDSNSVHSLLAYKVRYTFMLSFTSPRLLYMY